MTNTPTLRILLLGTPVVFLQNESLQIQRRLMRWMLFYLACQKDMVGRSDLILLFWPDEAEGDARRHLRETLSKLRAQLPDPELLITEQDRVGLDPQRVYSDVLEFEYLAAQTARACAQTPAATPLTQIVYQKVVRAVRLWRSARFLAGASLPESENLNNWLLSASQQLEVQHQRLLERLVDHDLASGDVESAMQWLQSALEGDETNASLHFRLLNLLHKQGRYSEALNYCTYLQELFSREGYSELPPALLSLSRKIREGAAQPAEDLDRPTWPSLADMQVPFIGRQTLLKEMQFSVRRGGPVILFGEAGSGKSRLVRELFFSLKPVPRLLLASARMMENDLPFQPIIDLLRHDVRAEEWKEMNLTWVTPLAMLLPELPLLRADIQPLRVAASQQYSLIFEALHNLLLFLSKKQRFLLFLDNAQWCDSATLAALAYLAERGLFGEPGTLILAARQEDSAPQLSDFLNRPSSVFSFQRLHLPPLDIEEIAALSRSVLGDAFKPEIMPRLERETGGNPLFLLETLRLVLDYSFDTRIQTVSDRLPLAGSVLAVIRERLQHLTPYDAQVFSTAAVIAEVAGGEFSMDLLEITCMLPPEQVALSIEMLVQSNLIQAVLQDRPSSGYTFVHEKIREVILLDLSPARKRLFHLRIARALEQKPQGQSTEMESALASHYEEAGELDSAIQHWMRAGLCAWQLNDKDKAAAALKRAEKILMRLGNQASDILIYQLYRQWGRLAYDIFDPDMVEQVYNRLLEFGKNRQNPLLAGSAYNGLAQAAELRRQPEKGLLHLEKANRYLEQVARLFEHIEALNRQGMFQIQLGQYQDAHETLQQALTLGERVSDAQGVEARSLTEYWLANLLTISGWPLLALEMAERSYRDAEDIFNQAGTARALGMIALAEFHLGRYPQSLKHAQQGIFMAEALRIPLLIGKMYGSAANADMVVGNLDACWQRVQEAVQIAEKYPFSYLKEGMQSLLGKLFYFLGAYEQAAQLHQQGSLVGNDNFHGLDNAIHLGLVQAALGDPHTGLLIANQAAGYSARKGLTLFNLSAQSVKASILIDLGQFEEAQTIIDLISTEAQRRSLPELHIASDFLLAKQVLCQGQPEQAAQLCKAALAEAAAISHLVLGIQGSILWVKITRQGNLEPGEAQHALQNLIQQLNQQIANPTLKHLLLEKLKSVDILI